MLVDLHAHSSGISRCCRIPYDAVIRAALDVGLDGIVLSNHYQRNYVCDGDFAAFARRYTDEFRLARAYGDTVGCKVFFGAEVTMERHDGAHLLLYGIEERFIEEHPTVFDLCQEELYRMVKAVGGAVIQAHPYRRKRNLLDTRFLDGIEVNCHPLYGRSDFSDMLAIASENGLILTCGGDFHADTYRPRCGVYLPGHLRDGVEIGRYLLRAPTLKLCIQEPNAREAYDHLYVCRTDGDGSEKDV
ncbi:MAG: hypothetical protein E7663_05895 [Ruminococcaceae bacterium]|nr:hypothetical protein [Oscillospiraceae bacterium]